MNLPDFLLEMLNDQYDKKTVERIVEGYSKDRYLTLRVNTLKTTVKETELELEKNGFEYEKVKWSKEAFIIKKSNGNIRDLEIYKQGKIYLQSLSSMLPPIILNPIEEADILDMAAAPGGKTTQLAMLSNNKSHITACEMNKIRAERLKYNIDKQGATCVYIMQKDARNIDEFFSFDQILLDAPCSGSGTLNKHSFENTKYFTKKLIERSIKSQIALLKKAIKILKPGGELVYSTCSILKQENEEVVKKAIQGTKVEIVPIEFEGMEDIPLLPTSDKKIIYICPTELYEGFFIIKLKKGAKCN